MEGRFFPTYHIPPTTYLVLSPVASSTIDLLAMTDLHHNYHKLLAIDLVDQAIVPHADSEVRLVSMKFLGASGDGVCGQAVNMGSQALLHRSVQTVEIAPGSRSELDGIRHRCALEP